MFCMNCGKALPDGAKFCMYCGTPLGAAAAPAQSGCCLPGRKYLSCDTLYPGGAYTETPAYQHDRERMRASELASAPYSGFDFTIMFGWRTVQWSASYSATPPPTALPRTTTTTCIF